MPTFLKGARPQGYRKLEARGMASFSELEGVVGRSPCTCPLVGDYHCALTASWEAVAYCTNTLLISCIGEGQWFSNLCSVM